MEVFESSKLDHQPEPYILHPKGKHTHTLILLHGTSTSGPEFAESLLDFSFFLQPPQKASNSTNRVRKDSVIGDGEVEDCGSEKNTMTLRKELEKGGTLEGVRFVFPSGSLKKTTVFGGKETHAWFDVHDFSDRTIGEGDQVAGMKESLSYLRSLVDNETKLLTREEESSRGRVKWYDGFRSSESGKERKKVMIGGFSQGCAMGMIALLSGELNGTAGFVGMSGWLPFRRQVDEVMLSTPIPILGQSTDIERTIEKRRRPAILGLLRWIFGFLLRYARKMTWFLSLVLRRYLGTALTSQDDVQAAQRRKGAVGYIRTLLSLPSRNLDIDPKIPIFLGHGSADQKVKYEWALQMHRTLMDMSLNLESRRYEGVEHWYCGEEMRDFIMFLERAWQLEDQREIVRKQALN